jgi:hypothetical protein
MHLPPGSPGLSPLRIPAKRTVVAILKDITIEIEAAPYLLQLVDDFLGYWRTDSAKMH